MKAAKKQSHSVILRLALLAFAVYLVVSMWTVHRELVRKEEELATKKASLESYLMQNEELTNLLRTGSDKEIIERAARDRLGYVYRDEIVFKQRK